MGMLTFKRMREAAESGGGAAKKPNKQTKKPAAKKPNKREK